MRGAAGPAAAAGFRRCRPVVPGPRGAPGIGLEAGALGAFLRFDPQAGVVLEGDQRLGHLAEFAALPLVGNVGAELTMSDGAHRLAHARDAERHVAAQHEGEAETGQRGERQCRDDDGDRVPFADLAAASP